MIRYFYDLLDTDRSYCNNTNLFLFVSIRIRIRSHLYGSGSYSFLQSSVAIKRQKSIILYITSRFVTIGTKHFHCFFKYLINMKYRMKYYICTTTNGKENDFFYLQTLLKRAYPIDTGANNYCSFQSFHNWLRGATVARLTPDQKAACSNHVGVKTFFGDFLQTK